MGTIRSRGSCPNCGGIQEKSKDDDGNCIWACRCCSRTEPRQTRRSRKSRDLDKTINDLLRR